jgi:hypothetical protein
VGIKTALDLSGIRPVNGSTSVYQWRGFGAGRYRFVPVEGLVQDGNGADTIHLARPKPFMRDGVQEHSGYTYRPRTRPDRTAQLLFDFMGLHVASTRKILNFTRTFGALEFCEHGDPCASCDRCEVEKFGVDQQSPDWYRRWSKRAFGLVLVSARLNRGELPRNEPEWRAMKESKFPLPRNLEEAKGHVEWELNGWIERGNLGVGFRWPHSPRDVSLDAKWPDSVFSWPGGGNAPVWFIGSHRMEMWSELARQLLLCILKADSLHFCRWGPDGGHVFSPARKRANGMNACCGSPECLAERNRANSRKSAAKRRVTRKQ